MLYGFYRYNLHPESFGFIKISSSSKLEKLKLRSSQSQTNEFSNANIQGLLFYLELSAIMKITLQATIYLIQWTSHILEIRR